MCRKIKSVKWKTNSCALTKRSNEARVTVFKLNPPCKFLTLTFTTHHSLSVSLSSHSHSSLLSLPSSIPVTDLQLQLSQRINATFLFPSTMTDSQKVPAATASLFVGELHSDVTTDQLYAVFSEFKSLVSVHICKDSATGKSLCYGYVNLTSRQEGNNNI